MVAKRRTQLYNTISSNVQQSIFRFVVLYRSSSHRTTHIIGQRYIFLSISAPAAQCGYPQYRRFDQFTRVRIYVTVMHFILFAERSEFDIASMNLSRDMQFDMQQCKYASFLHCLLCSQHDCSDSEPGATIGWTKRLPRAPGQSGRQKGQH